MRTLDFWTNVRARLEANEAVFVTLVADHTRHSPGTRGARLMLTADGQVYGTIGGGIMEKNILSMGGQLLADRRRIGSVETLYHRKEAPGATSGMICAGQQTNLSLVLTPDDALEPVSLAVERSREDRAGILRITTGGQFSFVDQDPEPGERAVRLRQDGSSWVYEEQVLELNRAVIFGGGHCGLALSNQLEVLGYVVTVIDTRADLEQFVGNTSARHKIACSDYAKASARVSHPHLTMAVVMTADFPSDTKALEGALREPFPFVGVMGAPAKLRAIKAALIERGFMREELEKITAPVGLSIGSSTPQEIAVSVAAQLIQLKTSLFPERGPSDFERGAARDEEE